MTLAAYFSRAVLPKEFVGPKSGKLLGFAARLLLAILVVGALAEPLRSQERRLEPVDEAVTDPTWVSFRQRLLAAVEKRDRKFVLGILAPNVRSGIEAPRGIAEFARRWYLNDADSPLWRELPAALFLGAAYFQRDKGPRELCAPYVLGKWPQDLDPRKHGAIITGEVLVKAEPSSDSATLQMLSYDIVAVTDWEVADKAPDAKQLWVKVRVKAGEGYAPEEQIRSAVEHSACFIKTEGGWRMTALAPAGG